ncbi:uncharacterized protein LOC143281196 [Babylonia areolata]|uniref:uncharacterized protein LOC143281196 n=1 Tax=Babylonia areolata TaxID=304850 RepID=UPI003FD483F1
MDELLFTQRSPGYKVGLVLVLVSVVCYLTGFSAPYWTVYSVSDKNSTDPDYMHEVLGHNGLWETCSLASEFSSTCTAISHHRGYPGWMSGVQGVQGVGLTGLVVASLYAGGLNFLLRKPVNNRYLEILLLLSGILGFTGSTIYAAESYGNDHVLMTEDGYHHGDSEYYYYYDYESHYGGERVLERNELAWAFAVSLAGSLLAIVSAVVIYTQNGYVPLANPRPVATVSFSTTVGGGGRLVFLPPDHLGAGEVLCPPPYSPSFLQRSGGAGQPGSGAVGCDTASGSSPKAVALGSQEEQKTQCETSEEGP